MRSAIECTSVRSTYPSNNEEYRPTSFFGIVSFLRLRVLDATGKMRPGSYSFKVEDRNIIVSKPIVHGHFYVETYTIEALRELCKTCGVEPQDINAFREQLEHYAAIYRWNRSSFSDPQSAGDQRKELEAVRNAASKLACALEALSWRPETAIAQKMDAHAIAAYFSDETKRQGPTTLISAPNNDGSQDHFTIELPNLLDFVWALENAAAEAAQDLTKSPTGRKKAYGIDVWISNVANLWATTSKQPFSREVASNGEPITNAARFCVGAFKLIEPNMDHSMVLTAMKHFKAGQNKHTGQISSKKEL